MISGGGRGRASPRAPAPTKVSDMREDRRHTTSIVLVAAITDGGSLSARLHMSAWWFPRGPGEPISENWRGLVVAALVLFLSTGACSMT